MDDQPNHNNHGKHTPQKHPVTFQKHKMEPRVKDDRESSFDEDSTRDEERTDRFAVGLEHNQEQL
jgi:hypothetical protein